MTAGAFDEVWQPLRTELDRWSEDGRQIRLWLRDDDAIAPSPALERLAALGERFDLPVLLAVIPMLAQPALAPALRTLTALLPCQHGCWHRDHEPPEAKKSEFGGDRPTELVRAEIQQARQRLGDLLGDTGLPVFVPPWNRIDPGHAALLPALGFVGLSCFRGSRLEPSGAPTLAHTHLDIMDWRAGRIGRPPQELATEACRLLAAMRAGSPRDTAFGLLLHHRDHDAGAWAVLDSCLALFRGHPAVIPTDPRRLFKIAVPS